MEKMIYCDDCGDRILMCSMCLLNFCPTCAGYFNVTGEGVEDETMCEGCNEDD